MSTLYQPYFNVIATQDGGYRVAHNCNGSLNFRVDEEINDTTANLLQFAFDEGKRQRSREIAGLLELNGK